MRDQGTRICMLSSATARTPTRLDVKPLDKQDKFVRNIVFRRRPDKLRARSNTDSGISRAASEHNQGSASNHRRAHRAAWGGIGGRRRPPSPSPVAGRARIEEKKAALAAALREVYGEAKGNGFDVKALRAVIRIRKQDENKRREKEAVLETYPHLLRTVA